MEIDRNLAVSFLIGYFVVGFVVFFWVNNEFTNLEFIYKLAWADLGLLFTILFGLFARRFSK